MKQKLFAIVSSEDGRIMSNCKGKLGLFTKAGTARQHAWRYGAKEGNHEIVEYQPEDPTASSEDKLVNLAAEIRQLIATDFPEVYGVYEAELIAYPLWCFKVGGMLMSEFDKEGLQK